MCVDPELPEVIPANRYLKLRKKMRKHYEIATRDFLTKKRRGTKV